MRRLIGSLVLAGFTCAVALVGLTALGVGGGEPSGAQAHPARPPHLNALQSYSEQAAKRNGAATIGGAPPISELVPLKAAAFARPVARYRSYSERQLRLMLRELARLESRLRANQRGAARAAWRVVYARYLRLGAVYGEFGALDQAIDGQPGGLPRDSHDRAFTGLHRLEWGLWEAAPPAQLLPVAQRLRRDVRRLLARLPTVQIPPLDYATRAHEILEDAQRDLLSAVDVPHSGAGVLATASGLQATREVIATLRPLLDGREDTIETVDSGLAHLGATLTAIRRAHRGSWPTLSELSEQQRERLNGTLGAALEALSGVPGTLETTAPPVIPRLPR